MKSSARNTIPLLSDVRGSDADTTLYMPLATMAVGTVLSRAGYAPEVIDPQVTPEWRARLETALEGALFLGVSSLTGPSIYAAVEVLELARERAPDVPRVWGGYHATQAFRSIFNEGLVDYVIRGAGEPGVLALAGLLRAATVARPPVEQLRKVPNLVFLDGHELVVNPLQPAPDMSDLPALDYSLIGVEKYLARTPNQMQYISSYGCPHACSFCAEPTQSLRRWGALSPNRTVDEMAHLWQTYKPERLSLVDPNFSTNPSRVIEIVHEMERRGLYIEIICDMRAKDVTLIAQQIDLKRLWAVGFREIFVGVESGSDRVLKFLRKGSKAEHALAACQLLDAAEIHTHASFIHDLPEETDEDSDLTFALIERLCELPYNTQSHHFYAPYPSTELYDHLIQHAGLSTAAADTRTQREWAKTSTFYGSDVWSGRPAFRRRVLRRLHALQPQFPAQLPMSNLPLLRRIGFGAGAPGGANAAPENVAS